VAPEFVAALEAFPNIALSDDFIAYLRSGGGLDISFARPPLTPEEAAVVCEQRWIHGPPGAPDVRVLVYTPPGVSAALRPAYLHIHGGGYVLGMPEQNDAAMRGTAADLGCVVVAPAYRLAPETQFPGALEDCYAALRWLHEAAAMLGVDPARIAIGGESAGGGHAAALAILARDRGEVPIRLQVLDSPMLDDRTASNSDPKPHPYCGEFVWGPANNHYGWRALLGMEPGGSGTPPGASASRVEDLSGLPPAFLSVGALDLFLEEDLEYARRLMRAGVPTELHVISGGFHGFAAAGEAAPQVKSLLDLRRAALARAFQRP
jgi:triacylglycerol lipase